MHYINSAQFAGILYLVQYCGVRHKGLAMCFFKELSRIVVGLNVRSRKSFKLYYIGKGSMCSGYHTNTLNALTDKKEIFGNAS